MTMNESGREKRGRYRSHVSRRSMQSYISTYSRLRGILRKTLSCGLHDNVPDRPSAKVGPAGCQLATMALKIKTVTVPKGGLHGRSCLSSNLGRQCIWAELYESGRLSAILAVHRLGRCRATRPWAKRRGGGWGVGGGVIFATAIPHRRWKEESC